MELDVSDTSFPLSTMNDALCPSVMLYSAILWLHVFFFFFLRTKELIWFALMQNPLCETKSLNTENSRKSRLVFKLYEIPVF